jgi:hypothetical protein
MPNNTNSPKRTGRILLWTALVVSTICNATTSILGFNMIISVAFGVLAATCVAGLVVDHRRGRAPVDA